MTVLTDLKIIIHHLVIYGFTQAPILIEHILSEFSAHWKMFLLSPEYVRPNYKRYVSFVVLK